MAISRQFKSCKATLFKPAKQAHAGVMVHYLDLISLYHFLLTSTECYQIAIKAFRKHCDQAFLTAVVTRNDIRTAAMLKQDPSLFSVCMEVEDYSFRQFILPAFIYYLFTWDQSGLELMLNAIADATKTPESALRVIDELLLQLSQWKNNGVAYKIKGGEVVTQQYYDPTKLCDALAVYEENEEQWDDDQCKQFIKSDISPLQGLMPVHLIDALEVKITITSELMYETVKEKRFGYPWHPVLVRVEQDVFAQNQETEFVMFYPHILEREYMIVSGINYAVASMKPHSGAAAAVREIIEEKFSGRNEMVAGIEARLLGYRSNPASLFKAAGEPELKKRKELPRPDFALG